MREIKFRAWDKEKNCMVYDGDTKWNPLAYPVSVTYKSIRYCIKGTWGNENVVKDEDGREGYRQWELDRYYQKVEIMEFTGFRDKDGTEIYEGDILRCQFDDKMIPINLPVRWYMCGWEPFNGYSDIFMNGYKPSDHLVVGNIYENPEIEYAKTPSDLEHDQEMIKEGYQRSDRDTRRGE